VLPADAKTREAFEWLADEIVERGGTAFLWEARSLGTLQDQDIVQCFRTEADARYMEIAGTADAIGRTTLRHVARKGLVPNSVTARLLHARRQLRGLERALRLERRRDYFGAPARATTETIVRTAIEAMAAQLGPATDPGGRHAVGH